MFPSDEHLATVVSSDLAGLVGDSSERDRMDEIVNEDIPGWFGLGGGRFIAKLDATALLLNARQYGDEHVKYGHTYGLVNACMSSQSRKSKSPWLEHDPFLRFYARS